MIRVGAQGYRITIGDLAVLGKETLLFCGLDRLGLLGGRW